MKTITLLSLTLIFGVVALRAASPDGTSQRKETFSTAVNGTALENVPGWNLHYGTGESPKVLTAAGYEGAGARFTDKSSFRRTLPSGTRVADFELRIKLRVVADSDAYAMPQILLGKEGGVNGLAVRFNGGTKDGWEDNYIEISSGGESWGKTAFAKFPDAKWRKDRWYEVTVSATKTTGTGDAQPVATVWIHELGAASPAVLADGLPAMRIGQSGTFEQIDSVIIGNAGSARSFDVDDIVVGLRKP